MPIPNDIPEHAWFESYGPDFTLAIDRSNLVDNNSVAYIDNVIKHVLSQLAVVQRQRKETSKSHTAPRITPKRL
jgi:hypothetical protein